ncbi:hypothetical protein Tco_0922180 [Tanacetum coccineum]|uniref:Uncharacterized protein n=1 Tax=Tanacetum coccineum TaxID=301880 RepID=A0ABQ5CXE1_9ASTR
MNSQLRQKQRRGGPRPGKGRVAEWSKAADCKSVEVFLRRFESCLSHLFVVDFREEKRGIRQRRKANRAKLLWPFREVQLYRMLVREVGELLRSIDSPSISNPNENRSDVVVGPTHPICSMIYGSTGATHFDQLAKILTGYEITGARSSGIFMGILSIAVGSLFKITAVPFRAAVGRTAAYRRVGGLSFESPGDAAGEALTMRFPARPQRLLPSPPNLDTLFGSSRYALFFQVRNQCSNTPQIRDMMTALIIMLMLLRTMLAVILSTPRILGVNSRPKRLLVQDIRNGGPRLSGSTLFPQSIRSSNSRVPGRASSAPGSVVDAPISNGITSENGSYNNVYSWNRGLSAEDQSPHSSKLSSEVDIYESSRYDAILLKEDLKNTSWLHSADDKIDEGSFFDNGFESLPEPFGPL